MNTRLSLTTLPAHLQTGGCSNHWTFSAASLQWITTYRDVDLWLCDQDAQAEQVDSYTSFLSSDESARARRFHFERDRIRFIVGRGVLRLLLATYLAISPKEIEFAYQDQGKPYLAEHHAAKALHFNLAHAEGKALYAISHGQEVGVDLERVHALPDAAAIASRFFSPTEYAKLDSVIGTHMEAQAFFNCWTRKEAFLKAEGSGLSRALNSFEVSLLPEEPPRILHIEGMPDEAIPWTVYAFEPVPGFVAALAVTDGSRPSRA
jgi:4'-phosphopantetheinyl transferase